MRMVVLMAVLLMTGCSAQATRDPAPLPATAPVGTAEAASVTMAKLDGTEWRFVRVDGTAVPPDVTATMRLRRDHASGKAGCNTYGARYHVAADGSASFSQTMSTKLACLTPAGAMQVEHRIFTTLPHVAKIGMQDGNLVLLDAEGKPLDRLVPASRP